LVAFYWHFIRQTKGWYGAMFAASLLVALLDTVIPLFIGRLVSLMESADRAAALGAALPMLLGMVALVVVVNTGTTPLLRAAIGGDIETARLLLEHGALVDLPTVHGMTPLMAAAGHASGRNLGDQRANPEQAQARAIGTARPMTMDARRH
jgi:hypothetical protein